MKAIPYLTLLITCFLLIACDSLKQEVDPSKLVSEPAKLIVACFISPQDTVLAARVSISRPVLGITESSADIPNAIVTLSDGTQTVQLVYEPGVNYYRADVRQLPIVVGKTYTLTAKTANGQLAIDASCTVPGPVALQSLQIDSATTNDLGQVQKQYYARLKWRDPAGEINFYRVVGHNENTYPTTTGSSPNGPGRDTLITRFGYWSFENGSTITDTERDGQELVSSRGQLSITRIFLNGQPQPTRPVGTVVAYLLNVDENYYRYHDEVERQREVRNNPFAEPVLIQTNIRGGLGCFGAYNKSMLVTELK